MTISGMGGGFKNRTLSIAATAISSALIAVAPPSLFGEENPENPEGEKEKPSATFLNRELTYVPVDDIVPAVAKVIGGAGAEAPQPEENEGAVALRIGDAVVVADAATNRIFVLASADKIRAIDDLIDETDVKPRQVSVTCLIVESELNGAEKFGVDVLKSVNEIVVGKETIALSPLSGESWLQIPPKSNWPVSAESLTSPFLTAYGEALEKTGRCRVLARPVVTAANGQPATFQLGEKNTRLKSQRAGSGVTLAKDHLRIDVTPLISDSGIILDVGIEGAGQKLKSLLTMADNGVAALGGLVRAEADKRHEYIAVLHVHELDPPDAAPNDVK